MDKLLLRPAETAEILGIARSRAYALIASGELPCVRIGKSVRVPIESLRAWVSSRQIEAQEERAEVKDTPLAERRLTHR
jgi:excisionase family DNA binding protein